MISAEEQQGDIRFRSYFITFTTSKGLFLFAVVYINYLSSFHDDGNNGRRPMNNHSNAPSLELRVRPYRKAGLAN